ncbi:MAG: glucose-1-phosphate adenylyltransferase [Candidatus Aminicenantes bacterium]|nr:glucose-1-phosphate adenylyltransferase [Candidatus Aminicenantes bacterium]
MAKVATMIMAGGQGNRLYPLTKMRSKPAVPIAGRFRLIDIPLSNCIHSGYRKIFVLTQFASESLHRHIFLTYRFDIFQKDFVTILSAQQTLENRDWYQGTADSVRQNLHFLENQGDLVLILSGDHLYRMDYRKFVDFHVRMGAEISISVIPVRTDAVKDFGVMKVDRTGRITEFREKPKEAAAIDALAVDEDIFRSHGVNPEGRTHLASMGIYIFNWAVLHELLENNEHEDFGKQVIPEAIHGKRVFGYFFDGYWEDIGTIRSFFEANLNLTEPLPRFNFYDEDRPIFTHARFLPGSKIIASDVAQSILCEGSIINGSRIRKSIVGVRSRIGEGCALERTIMMGADYFESREELERNAAAGVPPIGLGRGCEVRNAILDKNARIGNGVKLVNAQGVLDEKAENYCIVNGIIVVPKNAAIADGTVI